MQTQDEPKNENLTEEEVSITYAVWNAFLLSLTTMLSRDLPSMKDWLIVKMSDRLTSKAGCVPQVLTTTNELNSKNHALAAVFKWHYHGTKYVMQVILHPEYLVDAVRYTMYSNISSTDASMAHGPFKFEPKIVFQKTDLCWMPLDQVLEFLPHHGMAKPIVDQLTKAGMLFEYRVKPAKTTELAKIDYDSF